MPPWRWSLPSVRVISSGAQRLQRGYQAPCTCGKRRLRHSRVPTPAGGGLGTRNAGQTDPVLTEQLPGHPIRLHHSLQVSAVHQLMLQCLSALHVRQRLVRRCTRWSRGLLRRRADVDPLETPEAGARWALTCRKNRLRCLRRIRVRPLSLQRPLTTGIGAGGGPRRVHLRGRLRESEVSWTPPYSASGERFASSGWGSDEWKERIWAVSANPR